MRASLTPENRYVAAGDLDLCEVTDDVAWEAQRIDDSYREYASEVSAASAPTPAVTAEGTFSGRPPQRTGVDGGG